MEKQVVKDKLVKVEAHLPQRLLSFLEALTDFQELDVEEYVRKVLAEGVVRDVDAVKSRLWNAEIIKAKYDLSLLEAIKDC